MYLLKENKQITDEQDLYAIKAWTANGGQYEKDYPLTQKELNRLNNLADNNTLQLSAPLYRMIDLSFNQWNKIFQAITGIDFRPIRVRYQNALKSMMDGGDKDELEQVMTMVHNKHYDVKNNYSPKFERFQSFTPDFYRAFSYSSDNCGRQINWDYRDNYRIIYAIPNGELLRGIHIKDYSVYTDEDEYLISNKNHFYVVDAQMFTENTIILVIQS